MLAGAVLIPRLGRTALQAATVVMAGDVWWLHEVIGAHGLHTGSLELIAPQLMVGLGLGIGMTISPLFDFILSAVTEVEVGSASGVLTAVQQLGGAIGVAAMGTIFFSAVGHLGFVTALQRCLIVELATAPVLLALISTLPARAREPETGSTAVPSTGSEGQSGPRGVPTAA
jgi:hypothetical protein